MTLFGLGSLLSFSTLRVERLYRSVDSPQIKKLDLLIDFTRAGSFASKGEEHLVLGLFRYLSPFERCLFREAGIEVDGTEIGAHQERREAPFDALISQFYVAGRPYHIPHSS